MKRSKPFVPACENNKHAILDVLLRHLAGIDEVLEIGSGTGQHAVHMALHLPHLRWQTSDLTHQHTAVRTWIDDSGLTNVVDPLELDVNSPVWPLRCVAAIFSANTAHIMPPGAVRAMFEGVGRTLGSAGLFLIYGPFNYNGAFTSAGNRRLDEHLKAQDPRAGIRDFETVAEWAMANGLRLLEDNEMPANNRLLVWRKEASHR
jgi:cyclopropane fatty-acyl-phospholipid synthase-like methyltransferase